jgi:hypothetical protein
MCINVFEKYKNKPTFALLFLKTKRIKSHEKNVPAFSKEKKK